MPRARTLFGWGTKGRLLVLAFHRVTRERDPYDPEMLSAAALRRHLAALAGFEVVPLSAGLAALEAGRLQKPVAAITFDDGYRDQLEVVQPLLAARGYPSTVFVCPGILGHGNLWHDRILWALREGGAGNTINTPDFSAVVPAALQARRALAARCIDSVKALPLAAREAAVAAIEQGCGAPAAPRLMLDEAELRLLAFLPGVEIGAHTRHHPILASCTEDEAREEIAGSRRDLEQVLGQPVRLFAYPNGHEGTDFGNREAALAREAGFSHAFTADWGAVDRNSDRHRLPRIGLYRRSVPGNAFLLWREALRR